MSRRRTTCALDGAESLTPREHEVLTLVAQGKRNRDIADTLVVTLSTTQNHVHKILEKLQVSNRTEAAACYLRGLGNPE